MRRVLVGVALVSVLVPGVVSATTTGGSGDDVMRGNEAPNDFDGGPGLDVITGRENNDILAGGPGDDVIVSGTGSDTLDGGLGIDVCFADSKDAVVRCEVIVTPEGPVIP